ncbi:MAG: type IV pilin N-terminal domain-containing protein [Methanogenium sp.]|jgi:FlaG/FlaF family flagellin (archaellin)
MKNYRNTDAVSPVVGVMLMLVVTIIIAAVVSAFAGGLSGDTQKAPQAQIKGYYSISDGLTIEHVGGDAIPTVDVTVMIRPTKTFGDAAHMVWTINPSHITDKQNAPLGGVNAWMREGGYSGVKNFAPGSSMYVSPPQCKKEILQPGATNTYAFDYSGNVGKTFWLELSDHSGKIFARTEVIISP